ncbi:MAG: 50S ribosomal protein L30 [Bacteroidetes bacterium CG23_combo_of_CG06-09_8_20_14_all_32_9]|nr:MAG: 50S ribosomal protein L30 [Bacteroidetes bacterium CG23_combo_of_CG06-09_8_20_14_all_32_9]
MTKIKVTQTSSRNGCTLRQRRTLDALGLKKMHHKVIHDATPQILGMLRKVQHLIKTEEL